MGCSLGFRCSGSHIQRRYGPEPANVSDRIGRGTVQRGNNLPIFLHLAYREHYQPVEQCDTNAPHFSRVLIFRKSLCQIKAAQWDFPRRARDAEGGAKSASRQNPGLHVTRAPKIAIPNVRSSRLLHSSDVSLLVTPQPQGSNTMIWTHNSFSQMTLSKTLWRITFTTYLTDLTPYSIYPPCELQ